MVDIAPARGAEVRADGIVKSYGNFRAVDDVSVSAGAGEFLALLGPSGSGKTTLLMTIAGFEYPQAGDVSIGGRIITDLPPNQRDIGIVFQNYALFPHLSVRDNIAFPLRRRGLAKAEIADKVEAAVALVRLDGHGHKLPAALSGGQQQRVAIARATVFSPQLLLMDEPLGALDRRQREDMQFEIKELQRRLGVTIVYVTHDQEEAMMMADRIAVMRNGRLEQIGNAEELYDRPANAFVADFIGQTNLVSGKVAAIAGGQVRVMLEGGQHATFDEPDRSGFKPGDAVLVGVRPERLSFAQPGRPGLCGTLVQSVYSGGTRLFLIEIAPGLTLKMRCPSMLAHKGPAPGETVTITWDSHYVRLHPV